MLYINNINYLNLLVIYQKHFLFKKKKQKKPLP
jgi:hypothetical protein